jgi:hypothetical protein
VSQARVLPSQHGGYVSGKGLLGAVDVRDVYKPDSDGDLSWAGICRWPVDDGGLFGSGSIEQRYRNWAIKKREVLIIRAGEVRFQNPFNFLNCLRIVLRLVA